MTKSAEDVREVATAVRLAARVLVDRLSEKLARRRGAEVAGRLDDLAARVRVLELAASAEQEPLGEALLAAALNQELVRVLEGDLVEARRQIDRQADLLELHQQMEREARQLTDDD